MSNEMQQELASFRAHLTQVDHEQKAIAQAITKLTTQLAKVRRERRAGPVREDTAETRPSTPEEEVKRADAQVNAQVDLIEDMMRAEAPDPTWTDAAELSLQGMFHREEPTGFYLVHAECRTTVCRLELSLDGSVSPAESFRNLVHLMPWQGQGFVRIEDGESAAVVVYLAREGYAFPRAAE